MYDVSDDYLEVVNGLRSREFHTRCKFDGLDEYITEANIPVGTYADIIDGNNIVSMGNACSRKIEMTVRNFTAPYVWKGSRFTIENGLKVLDGIEWVPWGTFWVTNMSTSNDKRTIKLTAYDFMYTLSKRKYSSSLVSNFHYRDMLDEFLARSGLTLSTTAELPDREDADYTISSWPEGDFSYSDIAGHLAGMVGCNARISTADPSVLEFVWYTATGTTVKNNLYQDGFEKLSDSALRVDIFASGNNKEIEIENTSGSNKGELDFRPFDSSDPAAHPWLIFTYDDETMEATVKINPEYAEDQAPIRIPYSLFYNGQMYTVTSIPQKGFYGCKAQEIVLPETLKTIGYYAFHNCSGITELTIPESVTTIAGGILWGCDTIKVVYYNAISASATASNVWPFNDIDHEISIIIGDGVTHIGTSIFCRAPVSQIRIPESVTSIGATAFAECNALTSINIPATVTSVGSRAFEGCDALATVYWNPPAIASVGLMTGSIFNGCSALKNVVFAPDVTVIPAYFLKDCRGIETIVLPDSVETINYWAFYECTNLKSVQIGTYASAITGINKNAFYGSSLLTDITLYAAVDSVSGSPWGASNATITWLG